MFSSYRVRNVQPNVDAVVVLRHGHVVRQYFVANTDDRLVSIDRVCDDVWF